MHFNTRVILFISTIVLLGLHSQSDAAMVVAVNQGNQLFRFDSSTPGTTSSVVNISGLASGDVIQGIDARPSNGMLYGFARNNDVGHIYSIDTNTGVASLASTLNVTLSGDAFAVDFNPVADRLRIVSDLGQNLRVNVADGSTIVDGNINYAAGDPNTGVTPAIVAGAYTNSFNGALSTTLYEVDLSTQSLVTQDPPNSGTLNTVATLGAIAFPETSFDIDALNNMGYIVTNGVEFSTINLADGSIDFVGNIDSLSSVIGIATNVTAVPEPSTTITLVAIGCSYLIKRRRKRACRALLQA